MQTIGTPVGSCETVVAGGHARVVDLNVRLGGSHQVVCFHTVLEGCQTRLSRARPNLVLRHIGPEEEVALSNILSIVDGFNLACSYLAQVMLFELVRVNRSVVHFVASKVVVRYSILRDAFFLLNDLLGASLAHARESCVLDEELIVLVRSRPVVHLGLEAHPEVGHSH